MVDLPTAFGAGVLATFVPLYVGIFLPSLLSKSRRGPRAKIFLLAFSAGVIFWFFFDVMGDAASLDVNQGFNAKDYPEAIGHIVLALLFAIGLLALVLLDRRYQNESVNPSTIGVNPTFNLTFKIAMIAALGIGLHALGEGMVIGGNLPNSADLLEAIGGISPGIAYVLHKVLEGFVLGAFAVIAGNASGRSLGILGIVSGVPTIIGFFLGVPSFIDPAYFFALGAAGAIYIEIRLLPLVFRNRVEYYTMLPLVLGFYAMYFAGLFHGS